MLGRVVRHFFLHSFMLLICIPLLADTGQQLIFDYYFNNTRIGDALIQLDAQGNAVLVYNVDIISHLIPLLQKLSVEDHPLLTKKFSPEWVSLKEWPEKYGLLIRVDPTTFSIFFQLPSQYQPIQKLSISPSSGPTQSTVEPATQWGWLQINGILGKSPLTPYTHNGTWFANYSIHEWSLLAGGSYLTQNTFPINTWRIENNQFGKTFRQWQIGWLDIPTVINGQLAPSDIFGIMTSNSLNRLSFGGLLKELPGGMIQLGEKSLVEIFNNGLLVKQQILPQGRYRVRDLFAYDGTHNVVIRITSSDGRVETKQLSVENFPHQPDKNALFYSLFAATLPAHNYDVSFGGAALKGFGKGLAAGLHGTIIKNDGMRMGVFVEKYFGMHHLDITGWWQDRKLAPAIGRLEVNLNFYNTFFNAQPYFYAYYMGPQASFNTKIIETGLSFVPQFNNINLGTVSLGYIRLLNGQNTSYYRYQKNWSLGNNLYLQFYANIDTLSHVAEAIVSISINPIPNTNLSFSSGAGGQQPVYMGFNTHLDQPNVNINTQYARAEQQDMESARLWANWDNQYFQTLGTALWNHPFDPNKRDGFASLAYNSTLLFADGSFAFASRSQGPFAIVDVSDLPNYHRTKVKLNNQNAPEFLGRYAMTNMIPYMPYHLSIDPTQSGPSYNLREEDFYPAPNQAFRIHAKASHNLFGIGTLFLPNGQIIKNAQGEVENLSTHEIKEWFSNSNGDLVLEGSPGLWQGEVNWENQLYELRFNLDENSSVEGAVMLGDLHLQKR